MENIIHFDQQFFYLINDGLQNDFLDMIMPWWRDKMTWVPLYFVGAVFMFWKYKKSALWFLLACGITIGISDTMSSKVVKPTVKRLRPCRTEVIAEQVHTRVHCGGGYSFTSSHATNHFALAVFIILALGGRYPKLKWPLLLWASSIAFGQVYVGVHFPLDVISGALLGTGIAYIMYWLYKKYWPPLEYDLDKV